MSSQMSDLNSQRRRVLIHLFLGGTSVLALAACGGGGGGGDSTSEKEEALKAAYYKLEKGMIWTDVEALVGFPANIKRDNLDLLWIVGDVEFGVAFVSTGGHTIAGAGLKVGQNPEVFRSL
jgi:hypothetical protein